MSNSQDVINHVTKKTEEVKQPHLRLLRPGREAATDEKLLWLQKRHWSFIGADGNPHCGRDRRRHTRCVCSGRSLMEVRPTMRGRPDIGSAAYQPVWLLKRSTISSSRLLISSTLP